MIQIDGTDYEQPTDKAIIAYGGADYVLVSVGNQIRRVNIADFAVGSHNHSGETLRPAEIALSATNPHIYSTTGVLTLRANDWAGARMQLQNPGMYITSNDNGQPIIVSYAPYNTLGIGTNNKSWAGLVLPQDAVKGRVHANSYTLYACSAAYKTDIKPIDKPVERVRRVDGITYMQNGEKGVGISAEDLDRLNLPNLTVKDEDGAYVGVNLIGVIPLLLQSIKELSEKVDKLSAPTAVVEKVVQ